MIELAYMYYPGYYIGLTTDGTTEEGRPLYCTVQGYAHHGYQGTAHTMGREGTQAGAELVCMGADGAGSCREDGVDAGKRTGGVPVSGSPYVDINFGATCIFSVKLGKEQS